MGTMGVHKEGGGRCRGIQEGLCLGSVGLRKVCRTLQLCHSGVGDIDGGQQGEPELGFDLLSLRFPVIFRRRWRGCLGSKPCAFRSCGLTEDEVAWGRTK